MNKEHENRKKFKYILAPDFSLYSNYPKAYQMFNHWRKHAFSSLAQTYGVKVIPTLSWSTKDSFNWCFDGVERGSIVSISSVGSMNMEDSKNLFIEGFLKAMEVINPVKIIYFGIVPDELKVYEHLMIFKETYTQKLRKRDMI